LFDELQIDDPPARIGKALRFHEDLIGCVNLPCCPNEKDDKKESEMSNLSIHRCSLAPLLAYGRQHFTLGV